MDHIMAICDASTHTFRHDMQVETAAVTYAQTKNGIRIVMNTGDEIFVNEVGKNFLFRLLGTQGFIEFWGFENGYRILNAAYPSGHAIFPEEYEATGHQRYLEDLATWIHHGTVDYRIAESSLVASEMVEGAYLSNRTKSKVTFPVKSFVPLTHNHWDPGMPYSGNGGRDGMKL